MLDTTYRRLSLARDTLLSPRVRSSLLSRDLVSPRYNSRAARESLSYAPVDRVLYTGNMAWETALSEVLSVLKIQYRSDVTVEAFLNDPERVAQLRNSNVARMEYNRRCMREEVDSGIYSPPRARRIAKDVAIDYIRRFLDQEEDRVEMVRKIHDVAQERDDAIATHLEVQGENAKLREKENELMHENEDLICTKTNIEENLEKTITELKQTETTVGELSDTKKCLEMQLQHTSNQLETSQNENAKLREDLAGLKKDYEESRADNSTLRADYQAVFNESAARRDEISKWKQHLEKEQHALARAQANSNAVEAKNSKLSAENQEFKEKNLNLRDQCNVLRAREEEMRTLVEVQMKLLSPEKAQSDLASSRRSAKNNVQIIKEETESSTSD